MRFAALSSIAFSRILRTGAGEGIRTPDLLITNQLLYRPELRQPIQKWNYSTSHATETIPAASTVGSGSGRLTAALADDLEKCNPCGHGYVEALNMTLHGYGRQPVAAVPDQASQPTALGAEDQSSRYC